jgi:hypothetical protein
MPPVQNLARIEHKVQSFKLIFLSEETVSSTNDDEREKKIFVKSGEEAEKISCSIA